jgi:hypothetical protein
MAINAYRYPLSPYPGQRPAWSYVIDEFARVHRVVPDALASSGWSVASTYECVDKWLVQRGASPLLERIPVLSYGSNACPAKLLDLGFSTSVALACTLTDHAAVWAHGRRQHDGSRIATLASRPGHQEVHFVTYVEREQLAVLDRVEGNPDWYRRGPFPADCVVLENGATVPGLFAYIGQPPRRHPSADENGDHALVFPTSLDGEETA